MHSAEPRLPGLHSIPSAVPVVGTANKTFFVFKQTAGRPNVWKAQSNKRNFQFDGVIQLFCELFAKINFWRAGLSWHSRRGRQSLVADWRCWISAFNPTNCNKSTARSPSMEVRSTWTYGTHWPAVSLRHENFENRRWRSVAVSRINSIWNPSK